MLSADLKTLLDDVGAAENTLAQMGLTDIEAAHSSLISIASQGVPLDLLEEILVALHENLRTMPDPDLGLRNFERFIVSSRSPMSVAALLVRDPSALSDLIGIFSFSQSLSDLLILDPESFDLIRLTEGQPVSREVLLQELRSEIGTEIGLRSAKNRLRRFKQREILRIAYGDLIRRFEIEKTQQQLVYLAESICTVALEYCQERIQERLGVVVNQQGDSSGLALIGSQRFGANNLDYSNLLVMYALYERAGQPVAKKKTRAVEYFDRLMEEFDDLLSEANEYGVCYQLKFERKANRAGRRVCELEDTVRYLDQNATARDRLDLVQTKFVCGDQGLGNRFLAARKQICFRHYYGRNDLDEFKSLKHGIRPDSNSARELRNIKTGPGGLHDLEFTVNYLQLLVGKKIPALQNGDYYEAVFQLEKNDVVTRQESERLRENYSCLRSVSHCLQLCLDQTTDVLPNNQDVMNRLKRQLEIHFDEVAPFDGIEKVYRVAEENLIILAHLLQWSEDETNDLLKDFVLGSGKPKDSHRELLAGLGFQAPEVALEAIRELAHERHRFISSKRCRFFLSSVISDLIQEISQQADPDATLRRLGVVSASLGGKGVLWELFSQNRSCLKLYVQLCANTPYLVSILQANPGMIDELMDSLIIDRPVSPEEYRQELELACGGSTDIEPIVLAFKNSKHLQIGVSQLLGLRSLHQVHLALSAVADCCTQMLASREFAVLAEKHGQPWNSQQDSPCDFSLVMGGRVGAREPNYHSNISFWILFESEGRTRAGRNQKSIHNQQFFSLLATRVAKALSRSGPQGRLYELEKLPIEFGESTSLALSMEAFKTKSAKLFGAGSALMFLAQCRFLSVSADFESRCESCLSQLFQQAQLSAESWEQTWADRQALEAGASQYNLKRGIGGTLDVETVIHFLYLVNFGDRKRVSSTVMMLKELVEKKIVSETNGEILLTGYEQMKKIELYLRLMNLPRRHALPVIEAEDGLEDGTISDPFADALTLSSNLPGHREHESTQAFDLQVSQKQLAVLMDYDRFESLLDDVESYQAENRRLSLELAEGISAKGRKS